MGSLMKDKVSQVVKDFLKVRVQPRGKLLLGISGGPDSLALLYTLIKWRSFFNFELHLAHIDHNWREQSKKEALALQDLAASYHLPFHLKTLKTFPSSDRENWFRKERHRFFLELNKKVSFQAVLLAHHADDQSETFLKRICEGSGLIGLGGLMEEKKIGELSIWRPFLFLRKREIEDWIKDQDLNPFYDVTNFDINYLRARMRKNIFPHLEKHFGKNVGKNFVKLSSFFQELKGYLDEKSAILKPHLTEGPFGDLLDLRFNFQPLELKYFLQKYAEKKKSYFNSDMLRKLLHLIALKRPNFQLNSSSMHLRVSRHYLFILFKPFPNFFTDYKRWTQVKQGNWMQFWLGNVYFPPEANSWVPLEALGSDIKKKMKKWYSSHRVPPFLQSAAPIFIKEKRVIGECLTGSLFSKKLKTNFK